MSFKDWTRGIMERAKQGGLFGSGAEGQESNMANGGFSGYRPAQQSKPKETHDTQHNPVMPAGGMMDGGMSMGEVPGNQHTGFTGMFAPVNGAPQGMNGTGMYPPVNGGMYPPAGNTATYQPQQGTFQQNAYQPQGAFPPNWQQGGTTTQQRFWQNPAQPQQPQPTFDSQRYQAQPNTSYHTGMTGKQQPVGSMAGTGRYQAQGQQDNIRYMPGSFVGDDGRAYSHVERVAQLVSVSACYRIIEFMRNKESVIVNTESIANDGEIQRCMDMLSGAAFTLGCSITKITQVKRAYLIAPANVLVMPDMLFQRMSDREGSRWRTEEGAAEDHRGYRSQDYAQQPDYRQEEQPYAQTSRAQDGYGAAQGYGAQPGYGATQAGFDQQMTHGFGGFGSFSNTGYGR